MECQSYNEATTKAAKYEYIEKLITACKLIKLESSSTMWKDLENKGERKAQEKFTIDLATQAVEKAQDANLSNLSDFLSYLQLWNLVLSAKRRELKNIRNSLNGLEETNVPSFQ
jgi:hypothetical protein